MIDVFRGIHIVRLLIPIVAGWFLSGTALWADESFFTKSVAPILQSQCLRCHRGAEPKGGLKLSRLQHLLKGGESGPAVVPGKPDESLLVEMISGEEPSMPQGGDPLTKRQIAILRKWITEGAVWPKELVLEYDRNDWWSLNPLVKPALPKLDREQASRVRTPIDHFILAKLADQGLRLSPEADRRTLIRRLTFDLHGLPPTPKEIETFLNDADPQAYEQLVNRLLDSPRYGERWARHWLDVVHYGDTHGYDKDKRRPHAWPYRDYVIRAFNSDKSYSRFVREQLAGDVLFRHEADGIVATGFIAAGPWDFVGHVELREGTLDKKITRNLDRDDMLTSTLSTFSSLTVGCARCHDHKFDPISQQDYYSLQAVFAGVERANRTFEPDPKIAEQRIGLKNQQQEMAARKTQLEQRIRKAAGPELTRIEQRLTELGKQKRTDSKPEFGYHSQIEKTQNVAKWVQIDLGETQPIESILYVGCHDNFNNIGAGFGFPVRYKIEIADDPEFKKETVVITDSTQSDVPNPGVTSQSVAVKGKKARYIRITATRLAPRQNDYIFALAEMMVLTPKGKNIAAGAKVTSLDSIEAPVRWQRKNLVDGYYFGIGNKGHTQELAALNKQKTLLLKEATTDSIRQKIDSLELNLKKVRKKIAALPKPQMVYAAASSFDKQGNFTPSPGDKPRKIHLLSRGSVTSPGPLMSPGTVSCITELSSRFELKHPEDEGARRVALANWIVDKRNPLTWRSIVNRIWHYHFGRGIVDSPNDFGRMGSKPSHPELLDWLAVNFRDGNQSIKNLHRLIVTSAVYRQSSKSNLQREKLDGGNRDLWRMNRRRLEAESLRDTVLAVSGKLNLKMYGPGYDLFGFEEDHSPRYKYEEHNPDDPKSLRRTVYRFIVRSVPDPFMESLDCADPSMNVPVRNTTITALQALALLNNKFMIRQAEHFAARVEKSSDELPSQIATAYRLALGRSPTAEESKLLVAYAKQHGLANVCRLIFNMNEFLFVD